MLDCEPHGNLEVRGYEGSNTEAYLGSQIGRFYLRVKFSFQIKLYAYCKSKNYKVIEKLFICLEGEKGSENFMVCKILEYVVLYVEEVKKGDTSWDDLPSSKPSCRNISNTCTMLYIIKTGNVQGYLYCIHGLTHVDCLMCFRDGTATIGGMRKRIQGSTRPMYTTPRKMSGRKAYMHRLVNTLLPYGHMPGLTMT